MHDTIFKQTLKWEIEKGTTNNPLDTGGWTNDGITYVFYQNLCRTVLGVSPNKVHFATLTAAEVQAFYTYIWKYCRLDEVENMIVAGCCFDFAFNSGFGKREIQKVLQTYGFKLRADNVFGNISIGILNKAVQERGALKVCLDILDARQRYIESLIEKRPSQEVFRKG
jgi:lysozyme family protein